MPKNKQYQWVLIGIVIFVIFMLIKTGNEMSMYNHRECFVSQDMMGCEAEGGALTIDINSNCAAFMDSRGCQPENCQYYDDAVCGENYSSKNMIEQACSTDQECVDRFQNTGYWCYKGPDKDSFCKFEGDHWPDEQAERTDTFIGAVETFNINQWADKNQPFVVMIAGALIVVTLLSVFTNEKRRSFN